VELLGGGASGELWPTPGRIFAVSPQHTFHVLAEAIDDAFARWDRSHLHEFEIARLGKTITEFRFSGGEEDPERELDADVVTLGDVLRLGEEFTYTFDLGDNWRHRCLLADTVIDPDEVLGVVPGRPLPYWGWGVIPDAYGRLWDGDDGQTPVPAPPHQPWPWPDPPPATITTAHSPGQYTLTRTIRRRTNDDR
jgi:hypothetical protein